MKVYKSKVNFGKITMAAAVVVCISLAAATIDQESASDQWMMDAARRRPDGCERRLAERATGRDNISRRPLVDVRHCVAAMHFPATSADHYTCAIMAAERLDWRRWRKQIDGRPAGSLGEATH